LIRKTRITRLTAAALGAALLFVACGDDNESDPGTTVGGGDGGDAAVPACLNFNDLYALTGPEAEGINNWSDAAPLASELGSTTEFPDLSLSITAPGEESGTYGSYIEIALQGVAEARLVSGDITDDQVETTRKDYESSGDDNVIIDGVSGTDGSLGWVGFAFADQADGVRFFEVDGGEGCIAPDATTIADGSYPLSRPLYIYVNTAKAEDNPSLAAFVDFYLSDAGLASVEEEDYIPLEADAWAATGQVWADTGISAGDGDLSGEIVISGSSTVEPISANVGEKFAAENGDVSVSVTGPGTSDGIEQFCAGELDVADASRAIKDEEATACADAGVEYVELHIGIDGLSVITKA